MHDRVSSGEESIFSQNSRDSTDEAQGINENQTYIDGKTKRIENGSSNLEVECNETKPAMRRGYYGVSESQRRPTGNKRGLSALLEDAYRFSAHEDFSLPAGFLRTRRRGQEVFTSDHADEDKLAPVENKRAKAAETNVKANDNIEASNSVKKTAVKTTGRNPSAGHNKIQELAPRRRSQRNSTSQNLTNVKLAKTSHKKAKASTSESNTIQDSFIPDLTKVKDISHELFDLEGLENEETFTENPVPSTALSKHFDSRCMQVGLKSILFSNYEEKYVINFSADSAKYNPMAEIGRLIEYTIAIYFPRSYLDEAKKTVILPLNKSFDRGDAEEYLKAVNAYNELINRIPRQNVLNRLRHLNGVPVTFLHELLHIAYVRSIHPKANSLKQYQAFSNYVYGELLPPFLSKAFAQCHLKGGDIFVDLGSGVGNCVLQASLECGCALSFGCEIMPNASELTEIQNEEMQRRCKLFGLKVNPIEFSLRKSFVGNTRVDDILTKCDVLLINNFIFDSAMNTKIEKLIQNLKVGCKIISLKNLRGFGYSIDFNDVDNILNRLKVERFELSEGSVSWTHRGGEYFISTVLNDIDESIFTTYSKGRVRRSAKPLKYTR
ncbi:LAMI_0G11254g1_1 [Lachancea mirantina]|uniref:Histone-lysine N-methyltransferase, H3 lysine-79 specific n=1 Tax=Lachancea mirantina TaxID=1230905 RepID=A0A1G4KAY0_9SACH|nr:LAMI_0G11254g1_1 [Lachancea mirantina]